MEPETRDRTEGRARPGVVWLFYGLGLYLLPFVVVAFDEEVLNTNWLARHLPSGFNDAFQFLYWPILRFLT